MLGMSIVAQDNMSAMAVSGGHILYEDSNNILGEDGTSLLITET